MTTSLMCKCYATALCVVGGLALSTAALADDTTKSHMSRDSRMMKMDANEDGKVSSAEHAAGAKKMFEKIDADKDGRLTAAEMDASHKDMHKDKDMYKDKDKDMSGARDSKAMKSTDKMKAIDTNKDGVITAQEHETGSRQMFGKMDSDKDGNLTSAEIQAGHEKMMTAEEQ